MTTNFEVSPLKNTYKITNISNLDFSTTKDYYYKIAIKNYEQNTKKYPSLALSLLQKPESKSYKTTINFKSLAQKYSDIPKFRLATSQDWKNFGKKLANNLKDVLIENGTELLEKTLNLFSEKSKEGLKKLTDFESLSTSSLLSKDTIEKPVSLATKGKTPGESIKEENENLEKYTNISKNFKEYISQKTEELNNSNKDSSSESSATAEDTTAALDFPDTIKEENFRLTIYIIKNLSGKAPEAKNYTFISKEILEKTVSEENKYEDIKISAGVEPLKKILTPIQVLSSMSQIPDFLGNTFTAYLYMDNSDDFISSEFSFRLDGINIPLPKKQEYDLKFLNTSIKKIESITSLQRTLSLNIRADSDLYINSVFEEYSGVKRWGLPTKDLSLRPLTPFTYKKESLSGVTDIEESSQIGLLGKKIQATENEFTLYVVHNILDVNTSQNLEPNRYRDILVDGKYIIYTFTHVRLLGRTSAISLSSTNADPLSLTYDFSFKNMYSRKWSKSISSSEELQALKDTINESLNIE